MRKEAKTRQRHQQMVTETGRHEATCTTKNRTSEGGREDGLLCLTGKENNTSMGA